MLLISLAKKYRKCGTLDRLDETVKTTLFVNIQALFVKASMLKLPAEYHAILRHLVLIRITIENKNHAVILRLKVSQCGIWKYPYIWNVI